MPTQVDISENQLLQSHPRVLRELLRDHATQRRIFWATDSYAPMGEGYQQQDEITVERITGDHGLVIRPRALKSRDEQSQRVREMAEVFTPSRVCAMMVDYIDQDWHEANPSGSWRDYVLATVLEITCGEAPFLVSRYDAVSGMPIPLAERYGVLDRKLRVVGSEASDEDYLRWALLAVGSVYGYEWQGDNLVLAREAVVATFADYFRERFGREPDEATLLRVAEIVAWNLWQMDGLKGVVPLSCHTTTISDGDLFDPHTIERPCPGCEKDDIRLHNGVKCKLRRWVEAESTMPDHFDMLYTDIICKTYKIHNKTKYRMKFDYIIGNPPYQEETLGDNKGFAPPVYDKFLDGAYTISDKVEMIHPARFLFNAGSTPKPWNRKMLNDRHLKVLKYEPDASKVFTNTDIKGGVAITFHDKDKDYGAVSVFTPYNELNSILHKVLSKTSKYLSELAISRTSYRLTDVMHKETPNAINKLSKGHPYDMSTNIFDLLPFIFYADKPNDGHDYIQILGRENNERIYKYIRRDYVHNVVNLDFYKVLLPEASGTGSFGEIISNPIIGVPGLANTETFLSIGKFSNEDEAANLQNYLKCKFTRALLGIMKVTQHITPEKFKYVPLQDFTSSSDIDWSQSISDIDRQLYRKYGLSEAEVNFIESKVKPM